MSELTLIIISVLLIGMVSIPIIRGYAKQKKKNKAIIDLLKKETNASHLPSSSFEVWRENYCLGFDQKNNRLVFMTMDGINPTFGEISLENIRLFRPLKNTRQGKNGKEISHVISRISLMIEHLDEKRKQTELVFFDEGKDDYHIDEWEKAQSWATKLNRQMAG